jgi:signal transduction histidine kinase
LHYADDGKGILKENITKIFEPFFTTRRTLHNVGLGLSIAYNIVTKMLEGTIQCKSENGYGVNFYIEFPKNTKNIEST